jgi:hypothetical protein
MALSPTAKQLRLLRRLARERGESFATPTTRAQASREIRRLTTRRRSTRTERAVERKQISRGLADSGDSAQVRGDEITGYGATVGGRIWCTMSSPLEARIAMNTVVCGC